jgi:hypothetical protein
MRLPANRNVTSMQVSKIHYSDTNQFEHRQHADTQNVLELPSTAIFAPCAVVSTELVALIAPRAATSSTPAANPF